MKKIIYAIILSLSVMVGLNQTAIAAPALTKPHLALTKQNLAWPTDVLVENYSSQSVTVRFITAVSDDTASIDPYPYPHYFAQLLNQYYAYQVRVMLWDAYGRLFYDQVVGNVKRITLTTTAKNEKLSAKNVVIS